jgi:hypothetical protein
MYGARVAIVGDISQRIAASNSPAAFVRESNRGHNLWFVENLQTLVNRLAVLREIRSKLEKSDRPSNAQRSSAAFKYRYGLFASLSQQSPHLDTQDTIGRPPGRAL